MKDWNRNDKYDPADNYMDYKMSGAGGVQPGGSAGGNGGCGWGIIVIICFLIVLLTLCCK